MFWIRRNTFPHWKKSIAPVMQHGCHAKPLQWSMRLASSQECHLEWFSFECRKTKTKVITLANHKEYRQYSEPIKLQVITVADAKRGKMHASASQLVLVLLLIG